jgi:hypothetical protein
MTRDPRTEFKPRARPVADPALDTLLARDYELAREWAVALILTRPIEQLAEVPLRELAGDAPALCAQALRALGSDSELERLAAGEGVAGTGRESLSPERPVGALLGAAHAPAAVAAVEALRGVLWEALLAEILRPSPRLLGDVADRLACVCSTILAAALARVPVAASERTEQVAGSPDWDRQPGGEPRAPRPALLVDELNGIASPPARAAAWDPFAAARTGMRGESSEGPDPPWIAQSARPKARPLPWDTPPGAGLTARRSGQSVPQLADEPV